MAMCCIHSLTASKWPKREKMNECGTLLLNNFTGFTFWLCCISNIVTGCKFRLGPQILLCDKTTFFKIPFSKLKESFTDIEPLSIKKCIIIYRVTIELICNSKSIQFQRHLFYNGGLKGKYFRATKEF